MAKVTKILRNQLTEQNRTAVAAERSAKASESAAISSRSIARSTRIMAICAIVGSVLVPQGSEQGEVLSGKFNWNAGGPWFDDAGLAKGKAMLGATEPWSKLAPQGHPGPREHDPHSLLRLIKAG